MSSQWILNKKEKKTAENGEQSLQKNNNNARSKLSSHLRAAFVAPLFYV